MKLFTRPKNSARMQQMAESVGVDLTEALEVGVVTRQELRLAEMRCGECSGTLECKIWLAARRGQEQDAAPSYCPNHGLYDSVKI